MYFDSLVSVSFAMINLILEFDRVIHNTCLEWQQIKEAAEKAREAANSETNNTSRDIFI